MFIHMTTIARIIYIYNIQPQFDYFKNLKGKYTFNFKNVSYIVMARIISVIYKFPMGIEKRYTFILDSLQDHTGLDMRVTQSI